MGARNSTTIPVNLRVAPSRLAVGLAAVHSASIPCHGVLVKAICPGQVIYVGISNAVTTATGYPMNDGDQLQFEVKDATQLWFIADAAAQSVAILPYDWTPQ